MTRRALVLLLVAACGGSGDDIAADASPSTPDGAQTASDAAGADAAPEEPTWTGFAQGFFTTYCHECHGPGDAMRDYSVLAMVMAESTKIRCGVASSVVEGCEGSAIPPGQFPIGDGPAPSEEERGTLVRWIDIGMPE